MSRGVWPKATKLAKELDRTKVKLDKAKKAFSDAKAAFQEKKAAGGALARASERVELKKNVITSLTKRLAEVKVDLAKAKAKKAA